ncbi:MAG: N-acetylmuramoyl-L-alanine amidase [Candidatus Eremiobacteraeota bacterium]|nr:N-acetylmuramoyl-L-alanine amidase [Candidatus Eremiobacteraeota bacterium]
MPKKFSLIILSMLIAALCSTEAFARNTPAKARTTFTLMGEELQIDCFRKDATNLYLPIEEEKIAHLCSVMGGMVEKSPDGKSYCITRDSQFFVIRAEESDDSDSVILMRQKRKTIVLVKLETLMEALKAKAFYEREKEQYHVYPLISGIDIEEHDNGLTLTFQASSSIKYSTSDEENPAKTVITIEDACLDGTVLLPEHPLLAGATLTQNSSVPASVVLSIPRSEAAKIEVQPRPVPHSVVVKVSKNEPMAAGSSMPSRCAELQNISVEDTKEQVTITLDMSSEFRYQWSRLRSPDNRFFIDLQGISLSAATTEFTPQTCFVRKIRAAKLTADSPGTTRIVLDLTHPVVCEIKHNPANSKQLIVVVKNQFINPACAQYSGNGTTERLSIPDADGQTICIDPGHGGSDRGACHRGMSLSEKDVTLEISHRLASILKGRGWRVVMTRRSDRDVTYAGSPDSEELGARTSVAQNQGAMIFLSMHINASLNKKANGVSTHWYKECDKVLAREIQYQLVSVTGRRDRGIQRDRFYVLRNSDMPSVLVEAGFISNDEEARLLTNDEYLQRIATGIADGLGIYIGKISVKRSASRRGASSKK